MGKTQSLAKDIERIIREDGEEIRACLKKYVGDDDISAIFEKYAKVVEREINKVRDSFVSFSWAERPHSEEEKAPNLQEAARKAESDAMEHSLPYLVAKYHHSLVLQGVNPTVATILTKQYQTTMMERIDR